MLAQWLSLFDLHPDPHDKPRVAVSACLMGDPVRYDGDHKRDALVSDRLAPALAVLRVCPETGIGLPVPRPPIQVVTVTHGTRVQRVDRPEVDVTDALRDHADTLPEDLDGMILKARSPSCGVGTTPLYHSDGNDTGELGHGAFAAAAMARFPSLAVVNESHLVDHTAQSLFLLQCHLHQYWRRQGKRLPPHWHTTCQALPAPSVSTLRQWLTALA